MNYKYIVTGTSLVNNIEYVDGRRITALLGGCGFYAYTGLKMVEDSSLYVSVVGKDYKKYHGRWLEENGSSDEGLVIEGETTPQTLLKYMPNGDYSDVPVKLNEDGSFTKLSDENFTKPNSLTSADIEKHLEGVKGLYLFGPWRHGIGDRPGTREMREKYGYKVMWEVTPWKDSSFHDEFMDTLQYCDIYSFNERESFDYLSVENEEEAIKVIQEIGKPCFYRDGIKGSYMVTKDKVEFVPIIHAVSKDREVDPTGCGNSSTAAAMWAFCEGYSERMIAAIGNAVAAYNCMQYGPYPSVTPEMRKNLMDIARKAADGE
ncbi:MAG: carbohydrate kinase family protein [Oscillospiraceae bacterium]|jgi:sugar/nucleoside kinase (ribokinase family)